jgi:hypothetical protein
MRKQIRNNALILCLGILLFASCWERQRVNVLTPKKLEAVLYDYHLAQVMTNDLGYSERYMKDLYFSYVLDKHGVTSAEIDSALVYYARYPEVLAEVYTNLSSRLNNNLSRIEKEKELAVTHTPTPVVGDSADLWYEARVKQMYPSSLDNRFEFSIPVDTNFKAKDSFEWSGNVLFFPKEIDSLNYYLHLTLTAKLKTDSLISVDTMLYTSGTYRLCLDTIGAQLNSLNGNAYYKNNSNKQDVLLYGVQLMRYHMKEESVISSKDSLYTMTNSPQSQAVLMKSDKEESRK